MLSIQIDTKSLELVNNIKLSFFLSHMKSSFPLFTFNICCTVIRYSSSMHFVHKLKSHLTWNKYKSKHFDYPFQSWILIIETELNNLCVEPTTKTIWPTLIFQKEVRRVSVYLCEFIFIRIFSLSSFPHNEGCSSPSTSATKLKIWLSASISPFPHILAKKIRENSN